MSTAKFEKLIDLIINEDQERAEQLFHEIVVEKSREIYESLMDEEMHEDMSEDLLDEIESEEAGMHGMTEADEEEDEIEDMDFDTDAADMDADAADMDVDAADMDADMGDMDDMGGDEEAPATKGDIQDLEDKLDELIAEFEAMMGSEGEEEEEEGEEEEEEGESMVAEAIALKQVGGATYDKFAKGGDHGSNTKSPALTKPKVVQTGAGPVNFSGGGDESVPTSPKANMGYIKQGGDLISGAKNAPGSSFSEKGESTPRPVTKDAASDKRSPVAESKKSVKKIVR